MVALAAWQPSAPVPASSSVAGLRLASQSSPHAPAYRGLQSWHHRLGLAFAPFILELDFQRVSIDGRGLVVFAGAVARRGAAHWRARRHGTACRPMKCIALPRRRGKSNGSHWPEISIGANATMSRSSGWLQAVPEADAAAGPRSFLREDEIDPPQNAWAGIAVVRRSLAPVSPIAQDQRCRKRRCFASVCGDVWYEIDGATGALLQPARSVAPRLSLAF